VTEIRSLTTVDAASLQRIITGYTSHEKYHVRRDEDRTNTTFNIELVTLDVPYIKQYDPVDSDMLALYNAALQAGLSCGAYVASELVGMAIVGLQQWNNTAWVWEFHIAEHQRGKGIGRALMNAVIDNARTANCRVIVCETQNTNVPAIHFYRSMGFTLDAIDLSYYSNADYPDGEIAVFMKRRL
jgi:ribosomal protein S18 acetylase RimI-like enzyme